ncbi:MAG: molecular chaperone DnaJ [Pseudomonadota bacterium]
MTWLLLGAGLVVLAWAIIASALNAKSSTLMRVVKLTIGFLAMALIIVLLVTGRYGLAVSLVPVLLAVAIRWHGMASMLQNAFSGLSSLNGQQTPGQASEVESPYLRMVLDHDSGDMIGEVLRGDFAGRRIDTLGLPELLSLLRELQDRDTDGARLLAAWLDRSIHADTWRDAAHGGGDQAASTGGMSREEAAEILGVSPDADAETVREAHRKLMAANHPDKGGSPWLARQINLARDTLLGE